MAQVIRELEDRERPLVTFALFAYNQEEFIREAVEGALSQDYSPLQIILSDDCSTDQTYDIICSMARTYRGPALVQVNRNHTNLGITSHVNKIMEMAKGEAVILAAGDDISSPNRTVSIVDHMQSRSIELFYAHSGFTTAKHAKCLKRPTDSHRASAALAAEGVVKGLQEINGATGAVSSALFKIFGPLDPGGMIEDAALAFRASLVNGLHYLPKQVVYYRVHDNNTSGHNANLRFDRDAILGRLDRHSGYMETLYQQFRADSFRALRLSIISDEEYASIGQAISLSERNFILKKELELWVWKRSKQRFLRLAIDSVRAGISPVVVFKKVGKRFCYRFAN